MSQPPTTGFGQVQEHEFERIRQRRSALDPPAALGDPQNDAVGLALSGGGIRSASFNLGLLQAFERYGFLKRIDYLSTVSGGGYIGSCLTWFMSQHRKPFPFGTMRQDYDKGGRVLAWLREHGSYLTPGGALNLWALIGAALAGTIATLTVLVPVFLALVHFGAQPWGAAPVYDWLSPPVDVPRPDGFAWLMSIGLLALFGFLLLAFLYAVAGGMHKLRNVLTERHVHGFGGILLAGGVFFVIVSTIPWMHALLAEHLRSWLRSAISAVSVSGVLAIGGALRNRKAGAETHGARAVLLSIGLALAVYGLFLWFYHLVGQTSGFPGWLLWLILASVVIAVFANINLVSMHRFYRNRLMEAFMPAELVGATPGSAESCRLSEIPQTAAPYQIINTNVQLTGSKSVTYRTRGGDSFFLAPEFSGSSSIGFVPTASYVGGNMDLATALAISGAAVDPNTYATRSRPLTFLMTLFNVRLGYWIRNPRHPAWSRALSRPRWYWYLFREMFGRGLDEDGWQIHLSDGGHFENLGLYELIRRRCRYIIVCDAGADPDFGFGDLGQAVERVRTDFGVKVDIAIERIRPRGEQRLSPYAFAICDIYYDAETTGKLLYIKAAMLENLPEDVNAYRHEHPAFPHQSTADQFFDERQFEAYRELAYQVGTRLCEGRNPANLEAFFTN